MALEIDLTKYCLSVTVNKGQALYQAQSISSPECTVAIDGARVLKGKCVDSFNFVSHPWLMMNAAGSQLLRFGCDCPESRNQQHMCEHCACLALALMSDIPAFVFDTDLPKCKNPQPAPRNEEPAPEIPHVTREVPASVLFLREPSAPVFPEEEPPACEPEEPAAEAPEEEIPQQEQTPEPTEEEFRTMEIRFGDDEDGQPIFWYPNDTEQMFHTNVGIIGTMGTGKTQFAKSLLTQLYQQQHNNFDGHPLGILIFDYKGDYNETKKDFVKATKARVLKPYRLPYNPLALNPGKSFKPLLPMHTANEFKDTISQIYGLGPKQQQLLLNCIVKAYEKQGIDAANPLTWGHKAPTIDQVYDIYATATQDSAPDKLTAAMSKLHQFCLFESSPRKAVALDDLLRGVVVIDLSGYDSDIQSTIVAITLNQFYARMHAQGSSRTDGKFRQLRKFIMVDEADTFMAEDFPSLRRIMKEGREFGVGVILSTQSLTHYASRKDDYSRYVLTWIVHNVGDLKQRDVEYVFSLKSKSPHIAQTYTAIKDLRKHESVVKLGSDDPLTMHNLAFYQLHQLTQL